MIAAEVSGHSIRRHFLLKDMPVVDGEEPDMWQCVGTRCRCCESRNDQFTGSYR